MHRYIWLVPLLPLLGAAINGLLGRKFRFSERLVGGIAVGARAPVEDREESAAT